MRLSDLVKKYLEVQPLFRERKNKDRGMVNLLMEQYPALKQVINEGIITKESLIAIVQDYATMDRAWRKILEEDEELRGSDYNDKDKLESKTMENLGYRPPKSVGETELVQPEKQQSLIN